MIDYIIEKSDDLCDFAFWGGAKETAQMINELDNADDCWNFLESTFDGYETPITDTMINDFVWFDAWDMLAENGYLHHSENEIEHDVIEVIRKNGNFISIDDDDITLFDEGNTYIADINDVIEYLQENQDYNEVIKFTDVAEAVIEVGEEVEDEDE